MSGVWLAAHQALTLTLDLLYRQQMKANSHKCHRLSIMGKKASPSYLIVTSGILEDVMSDKRRGASLCAGLSGKRRAPASVWADFSLACAEIQIYSDTDLV